MIGLVDWDNIWVSIRAGFFFNETCCMDFLKKTFRPLSSVFVWKSSFWRAARPNIFLTPPPPLSLCELNLWWGWGSDSFKITVSYVKPVSEFCGGCGAKNLVLHCWMRLFQNLDYPSLSVNFWLCGWLALKENLSPTRCTVCECLSGGRSARYGQDQP